jgi:hypothetical protein
MATNRTALFSRRQPGGVFTVQDMLDHPGDIWFVDSGASAAENGAGFGKNPDAPFATLDYAVGQCTANNGDTIYLMPGHAETIIAESGVDIDVAGIRVIGLGHGATRPTFTFTTDVAADFKLAAASTHVENLIFLSGINATTGIVEVTAADCSIVNCEFRDSVGQATDCLVTDEATRLLVDGCRFVMAAADGGDSAIMLDECDDAEIRNCYIYGNFDVGAIQFRTTASDRVLIHDCRIWTEASEDLAIDDHVTGSTGIIGPNIEIVLEDNTTNITEAIVFATGFLFDPIYIVNLAGEKGMLTNITASTDA